MQRTGWDVLGSFATRVAFAVAVLLTTTVGGVRAQAALAADAAAARASSPRAHLDPAETVFAFEDDLDAVNYAPTGPACQAVFSDNPAFEAALRLGPADIANDLRADAEPTIEICFNVWSPDEVSLEAAAVGFADFHERAFDFADAVSH